MQNKNEKLSFGRKIFWDRYKLLKLGQVMSSQSQLFDCFIAFLKKMTKIQNPPHPKNLLSVKQFSWLNKKVHKTYRNRMSTQHSAELSCPSWRLPVGTPKLCAECYATLKSPWWQGKVLLSRPCRLSFIGNKLALIPSHWRSNNCPLWRAGYTWGTGKENQKQGDKNSWRTAFCFMNSNNSIHFPIVCQGRGSQ